MRRKTLNSPSLCSLSPHHKKRGMFLSCSLITKQWAMIVQLGLLSAAPKEVKGRKKKTKTVDQLINESLFFKFDLKG